MAGDVFDLHDRVIDENAHHEGKRRQGDHVQRKAKEVDPEESRQDGQRQGGGRYDRGAPVTQEEPHHDHRQNRPLIEELHRCLEVLFGCGNVVDFLGEPVFRVIMREFIDRFSHVARERDLVGTLAAHDLEGDHRLAVEQCDRAPLAGGVGDARDLVKPDASAIRQRDVETCEIGRGRCRCDRPYRLLRTTHITPAARRFLLDLSQAARDVRRGNVQRCHARGIELDMDFASQSADAPHTANAVDREQLLGYRVVDKPGDCLLVTLFRRNGEGHQRASRGGAARDRRIADVRRQFRPHPADRIANVVHGLHRILFQDELDGDRDGAFENLRIEVLDAL